MRHVVVMTATSSLGLTFMFLIDAATIYWVSKLGDASLVAALGFVWTVQFFTISVGIGLMIATTALVSRALGARRRDQARHHATTSILIALGVQVIVALGILIFAPALIGEAGATGETADIAVRFLRISVSALPLMIVGMVCSAILRAEGDALRSMTVTLTAGILAMVLDPLFIFTFGLGIDGAAYVIVLSRIVTCLLALYYIIGVHDLAAKPSLASIRATWLPFWVIAIPALATAMAGPFGNYLLTRVVAEFGDEAVAGWAVVSRLSILAFGGIFALSGAVGGIFGQNYGAGRLDRVARTFTDGLIFCAFYVGLAWALLWLATGFVVDAFELSQEAVAVLQAFTWIGAGGFFFQGIVFVANAGFNNMGRPGLSAVFTWTRDGLLSYPLALLFAGIFFAPGVIYAQTVAAIITGCVALVVGWRFVNAPPEPPPAKPVETPAEAS